MRYPPSTVNVARLPQAHVPDSSQQNQLIQQIGARVKTGLDQRKAARLRDELLTPEQKQAALAQESINIQEEQAHTQVQQKAAQDREFVRQQSRYQEIMSDPEQYSKMMELYDLDPQMAGGLMSVLVSQDEALKAQVAQQAAEANRFYVNYGRLLASDGKEVADKYLRETARQVVRSGGDVSKMAPLLTLSPDEALAQSKVMAGVTGTVFQLKDVQQAFENSIKERQVTVQERNADTAAFNAQTSRGNLDLARQELQQKAAEGIESGGLEFKDLKSVNNDVGKVAKPVREIHAAAKALDKLKETSSPTDQIAALFKFMKSLDPSSTVRDSELGLVYSAEGAAGALAAKMNQIMGEGGITGENFKNLVATAKSLANSAIESGASDIDGYLDAYGDRLPGQDKQRLKNRLPKPFESDQQAAVSDEELFAKYGID